MTGSKKLRNLLLASAALVFSTSVATTASAADFTVSVNAGGSFTQMTEKDGYKESVSNGMVAGLTFGYAFNDMFSVELTGGYRGGYDYKGSNNDASTRFPAGVETKAKVSSLSLIPALKVSYPVSKVTLYGLVGAGLAWNSTSESTISYNNAPMTIDGSFEDKTVSNFAYTLGAGLGYNITEKLVIDLGYRFADLGKFKGGDGLATATIGPVSQTSVVDAPDARHPVSHEIALTIGYRF